VDEYERNNTPLPLPESDVGSEFPDVSCDVPDRLDQSVQTECRSQPVSERIKNLSISESK
jgi:hypothetical protein